MSETAVNSNDAHYDKRLEFANDVLEKALGTTAKDIKPVAYERGFPFPYNNFVYAVEVEPEASASTEHKHQQPEAGTTVIPPKLSHFILRLANSASGYNDNVRIENEVASLSIAYAALEQAKLQHLVPRVFAWGSASGGQQGWILQEFISGSSLLEDFDSLSFQNKDKILLQMAEILGCFQRYQLPNTITEYGGVKFNSAGQLVSAPLSILDGGPFSSYEALVRATVASKLNKADGDPRIQGWRKNGVRDRIDNFISKGLHSAMAEMGPFKKVLVHADYSFDNLLYDKDTMIITGVIDFDFSHVATVADEFLRSLGHGIGRFPASRDGGEESAGLRKAMLHGFPSSLPPSNDEVQWEVAKAWDDALRQKNVERPSTIACLAPVSEVFWLSSQILPFKVCNEVVIGNSTEEQLAKWRQDGETLLIDFLTERGY